MIDHDGYDNDDDDGHDDDDHDNGVYLTLFNNKRARTRDCGAILSVVACTFPRNLLALEVAAARR